MAFYIWGNKATFKGVLGELSFLYYLIIMSWLFLGYFFIISSLFLFYFIIFHFVFSGIFLVIFGSGFYAWVQMNSTPPPKKIDPEDGIKK